jgi:hypothetical protein
MRIRSVSTPRVVPDVRGDARAHEPYVFWSPSLDDASLRRPRAIPFWSAALRASRKVGADVRGFAMTSRTVDPGRARGGRHDPNSVDRRE